MAEPRGSGLKKGGVLAAAIALIIGGVISMEGDFVDHEDDPGGATRFGVTEEVARSDGFTGDMASLPRNRVITIYGDKYVVKPGFDRIVARSTALGEEVIDAGVNLGPRRPSCYLQSALNALNRQQRDYANITEDCAIGPATMAAYDALARKRGKEKACELVLKLVDAQQAAHYLSLARNDSKFESFMPGWVDHRLGNVPIARCADEAAS
ncbi:glycoside hydrolase family 108 protein [Altericroceibacterium endophyticum]|uniref:Uncharacterized protein n=1 Tax=Altericroceibacterium endophyticum TaxID=1808508 RepID=A0A6I4T5S4_9SPHN|nr:glycosyl hydrolase 108 family protein [Altericroceibacterium endophyticum]MXO66246.1 hypothetical protein [Altericroceibacterium endophyticum]